MNARALAMHAAAAVAAVAVSIHGAGAEPAPAPAQPAAVNLRAGPAATARLTEEIAAKDKALFDAVFGSCDLAVLKALVADDFEFFHDKDGLSEKSGAQFLDDMRHHCERIAQHVDFRARRELVPGSLAVYPLNNYGAVETGKHDFYAVEDGKPDRLTESAQFLHVWKNDNGTWKLARVISYDHRLAPAP